MEALQQRVEALLKRQSELERQVHVFQQDIKALTLQNEVITQENARLRLEMDKAAQNSYAWGSVI
jgi:regulator of replication initiation timing